MISVLLRLMFVRTNHFSCDTRFHPSEGERTARSPQAPVAVARAHTLFTREPIFREDFQIVLLSEFALRAPLNTHYGLLTRSLALSKWHCTSKTKRANERGRREEGGWKERNYYIILIMLCGINDFSRFPLLPRSVRTCEGRPMAIKRFATCWIHTDTLRSGIFESFD